MTWEGRLNILKHKDSFGFFELGMAHRDSEFASFGCIVDA